MNSAKELIDLAKVNPNIAAMFRSASRKALCDLNPHVEVVTSSNIKAGLLVYGSHQAFCSINVDSVRIKFKVHFNLYDTNLLTSDKRKSKQEMTESRDLDTLRLDAYDLFSELVSSVGGFVKRTFRDAKIESMVSLPVATEGFGHMLETFKYRASQAHHHWEIQSGTNSFVCSVWLDNLDNSLLTDFKFDENADTASGKLLIYD